jgi:energy-coupling factor transporter ATP-binding protein EcfA2
MSSQLIPPSISNIRAKFVIEKLNQYASNTDSINLFITGRTGSGKSQLANLLLGIDCFLSTGRQDCTKVVNLFELTGLKCFDLPGSFGECENINRSALLLPQIDDEEEYLTDVKYLEIWNYSDYPKTQQIDRAFVSVNDCNVSITAGKSGGCQKSKNLV